MFARHATNANPRSHGASGDVVFDAAGVIYSVSSMNGAITILKQNSGGVKQLEAQYGTVTGTPSTVVAEAVYCPNEGENIYVTGHSQGTSLTGNSATFNIFLHKVKTSDLAATWTRHWGLDGAN